MKRLMISVVLAALSTATLADNMIVTKTQTWKNVPITVDADKQTYTYEGTLPDGDFYYTYSGYRCLREKTEVVGVDAVVYHSGVAGGTDIYCYPE